MMSILISICQGLVGLGCLMFGFSRIVVIDALKRLFGDSHGGRLVRWGMGILALLAGVMMWVGLFQPFLVFFASLLIVLILVVTMSLQWLRPAYKVSTAIYTLLLGSVLTAFLQPLGLRILALPHADDLPLKHVASAHIVKTYDPGLWFESVKAAPDGTIYLAGNSGENYVTGDKSQVHAKIIARTPDGAERVVFELPQGSSAGVMAFAPDGQMYLTSQGEQLGVWRFKKDGQARLLASLPKGSWPNGLTVGPDGLLYVADSLMGIIWRVDPVSGAIERVIQNNALMRRPWIAIAPGANGIHFYGRKLYVTVSDAAQVLEFELTVDGHLSKPSVFATGIPGDDFAIDAHGALYITTHPFNTIVRVSQTGERTIIANAADGIMGATDVTFGTRLDDSDTLYVSTDGGAFSGDAQAKGALVSLKIADSGR